MLYMIAAAVLSAAMMLALMPVCIKKLHALKFGQTMYELGPQSHLNKKGTPNMGGIVMGPVTLLSTVAMFVTFYLRMRELEGLSWRFWGLENPLWALLFLTIACMLLVGFADDYIKDVKKDHEGLKPRQKIVRQVAIGLVFAVWAYFYVGHDVIIPFTGKTWDLGIFYIPLITLTVLFMTNSANLQDGLDGLLSTVTVVGMIGFGLIAFLAPGIGKEWSAAVCGILAFALAGAAIGFLRFNHYPAQIFMGDTGSMFIGYMLAAIAILGAVKTAATIALIVPAVALGLPIMDTAFAILRRYSNGKPIFQPDKGHLHHRLLALGLTQKQAVLLMYAISIILSLGAFVLAMANVYVAAAVIVVIVIAVALGAKKIGILRNP